MSRFSSIGDTLKRDVFVASWERKIIKSALNFTYWHVVRQTWKKNDFLSFKGSFEGPFDTRQMHSSLFGNGCEMNIKQLEKCKESS